MDILNDAGAAGDSHVVFQLSEWQLKGRALVREGTQKDVLN